MCVEVVSGGGKMMVVEGVTVSRLGVTLWLQSRVLTRRELRPDWTRLGDGTRWC